MSRGDWGWCTPEIWASLSNWCVTSVHGMLAFRALGTFTAEDALNIFGRVRHHNITWKMQQTCLLGAKVG